MAIITLTISAVLSIIFGIIVLAWPKSLNYIIGIWLLLNGILGVLGSVNIGL